MQSQTKINQKQLTAFTGHFQSLYSYPLTPEKYELYTKFETEFSNYTRSLISQIDNPIAATAFLQAFFGVSLNQIQEITVYSAKDVCVVQITPAGCCGGRKLYFSEQFKTVITQVLYVAQQIKYWLPSQLVALAGLVEPFLKDDWHKSTAQGKNVNIRFGLFNRFLSLSSNIAALAGFLCCDNVQPVKEALQIENHLLFFRR